MSTPGPTTTVDSTGRGHSAKGLFTGHNRREAAIKLGASVPGTSTVRDESLTKNARAWWKKMAGVADYTSTYPKIPMDFTPNKTTGNAASGARLTNRATYKGGGVELVMPSADTIKKFARNAETFDIPASVTHPNGSVDGWLRVTRQPRGEWSVSGINMGQVDAAYAAEAVSAVLEARKPTLALEEAKDLIRRRKLRFAQGGSKIDKTKKSGFIGGVAYNAEAKTMAIVLRGKAYTYQVEPEIYKMITQATSPGDVYNTFIKMKKRRGGAVVACERCNRFSAKEIGHRCPSFHHAAPVGPANDKAFRDFAKVE